MNTTYRSIWNASLGAWVAVSEITRSCGKRSAGAVTLALACSSVGAQAISIDGGASATVPGTYTNPWAITGTLTVGDTSQGTLTVESGATISNNNAVLGQSAGATGNATVTGAGSAWASSFDFYVGYNGAGTLNVQDGGKVSNGNSGYLGLNAGGIGNATVTGAGSTWTNAVHFFVGYGGAGTLTVQDGGKVSNTSGYLGMNAGSVGNALVAGAGSTWTNSGILDIGRSGTGTLTVANGGHVSIDGGTGVIDVALFTGSAGVLNIGAAAGSAAEGAGTVAAGELRFGAGTGSLNFNHTDTAYVFGTRITGAGVLNHYAGTTILTGANTYTGATTISGGTLRVNGSIANSAVTVNSGGTLGGSGTVGNTSVSAGGVLAPGNSIGTLTVNGNLSFAPGSTYRVEVDAAGANDRTNVTGTAALSGTVDVQASAGTYAANTNYTLLHAAGGLTGNFAGVTSNLAFLTPALAYDANNVFLSLARNGTSFASVAITPNQIATSTALQNAGSTGDMGTVQTALTGLSAAQARAAYDAASGSGIVALRNAGTSFAAGFGSLLQARVGAVQGGSSATTSAFASRPILLASNGHVADLMLPVSDSPQKFSLAEGTSSSLASSSASSQGRGFWLRGAGGRQNTGSDGNAAASQLRNGGVSAGFDAEVREGLLIGGAVSRGTARLSFDNSDAGKSRSSALAIYGSYATGPWNFSGSASMGWGKNHLDRNIVIGALNRVAASDFDSTTLSAYGEASYAIAMNGWTLQPLAGLSLGRNKADGFTETGAGALNLQVSEQTINSSKAMLGAKAFFDAGRIRFEPRVIWAHEFGDLNTPMTAQFQGAATASPFQVSGAALKRDTLILGLGASGSISRGIDLFADVQAEHNSAQRNLALLVGLRSRW